MSLHDYKTEIGGGFDSYCNQVWKDIDKAYRATTREAGDERGDVESQLDLISTLYPRVRNIQAAFDHLLDIAIYHSLPEKVKSQTELDRKISLDYRVAEERAIRNKVNGLVKSMEHRITVLQSRLKSSIQERNFIGK